MAPLHEAFQEAIAMRAWMAAMALALPVAGFAEPVVLRYACMDGADSMPVVRRVVADFERANPGIRVEIEPTTDEYAMKLLTQTAAHVQPDVAWMNVSLVPSFAARGALLPLDEFIRNTPSLHLADYYPTAVKYFRTDGNLYGLPRDVAPFGLVFYNKTLFDHAHIPYPDSSWTWSYSPRDQLRQNCFTWVIRELTKKDAQGKTTQWGFAPAWPQLFLNLLIASKGLKLWDSDGHPTKITADTPEIVRLTEFAADCTLTKNWIPTYYQLQSNGQSTPYDEFVKGHAAMLLTFAGDTSRLRKDMARAGFDWDATLFPGDGERPATFLTDSSGTVIFSGTKHPREAWLFTQWMSGEPGMRAFASVAMQPAIRCLATEPGVWLPAASAKNSAPAHLGLADKAAMEMQFDNTPDYFEDTRIYLDSVAFDILSGSKPPRETLKRLQVESQTRLDGALRRMPRQPYPITVAVVAASSILIALAAWVAWPENRGRTSRKERSDGRVAYLFLLPMIGGMLVFTIGPIIYSFFLSLSNADNIRPPLWRGFQNYADAISIDPVFQKSVLVTAEYTALSVPINVLFALGLALLLNQKVWGMPLFRALYYLPSLVSGVAASLIWMQVFNPETGIMNRILYGSNPSHPFGGFGQLASNLAGTPSQPVNWLANEHTVLPAFVTMGLWGAGGGTIIFLAGLQGISQSFHEAAMIDGASTWLRFRRITMPLLSPTVFFSIVTGTIGSLQAFTASFVMTQGGPNNATMFYMLNLYIQGFKSLKLGYASALAWLLFGAIVILTGVQFLYARRWVHYQGEAA